MYVEMRREPVFGNAVQDRRIQEPGFAGWYQVPYVVVRQLMWSLFGNPSEEVQGKAAYRPFGHPVGRR